MTYSLYLDNCEDLQAGNLFCKLMELWHDCEVQMTELPGANVAVYRDGKLPEEGYRMAFSNNKVVVYGNGMRGVSYALVTLLKHYDGNDFRPADCTGSPSLPFRGVHLYMPAKEDVEGFKRIIDMLVLLKLNTLILEVGGGMEYKNHPEINTGWERFCATLLNFPGGPEAFQGADSYWKDSTHIELGGGSFLSQETVRELVDYAKGYGIDIVPELQFCSHAYYITTVYPEMAERQADHYPDTVCPHSEEAYKLYFELAMEVMDVFKPKMVSIGHDEIRVMGHCDVCRNYSGHELLAYEINRLHAFYQSMGVSIAMWCEKLQNVASYFTKEFSGGLEENESNQFGRRWHLPATYDAIKDIPKDILFLDWRYGWSWDSQKQTEENGFRQIFGNFHGEITRGWKKRLASPCVIGGETSSWCLANEFTLGRDGIIGDIWYSALLLWDKEYDENNYGGYLKEMQNELPRLREMLRGKRSAVVSEKTDKAMLVYAAGSGESYTMLSSNLPKHEIWDQLRHSLPEQISGTPLGEKELFFPVGKTVNRLLFVHTCLKDAKYVPSYNIQFNEWCPAVYAIRYSDGSTIFANVRFGIDIGYIKLGVGRKVNYTGATPEDPHGFDVSPDKCPDPPLYVLNSRWQNSLMYSASPFPFGENSAYIMEWENPRPEVAVERVFTVNTAKTKEEQALLYCVAAILD